MRKWICLLLILFSFPAFSFAAKILVLDINGAIGPASQDYIQRGIARAENEKAAAVILQLNTPGGLESSTREINKAIINSRVPVIVYVAPSGARAASAGTFLLYASHYAAMASGTNVGAASPISLGDPTSTEKNGKSISTAEKKAMQDAAAYMRSLAQLRGRNADWGNKAVTQGDSISAEEAKRLNVIDDIANDHAELLHKANGKATTLQGKPATINTQTNTLEKMPTDWRYDFLSFITNPNVAYILMLIAIYGIFFELSNPGLILPGVAGVIALLLVLYAFQLMPVNYVGLTLILVGISFILLEVYVGSYGMLGIGGLIAFIIGSVMLFDTNNPNYRLALFLIASMSAITFLFFFMILTLAIQSHKKAIVSGKEALIGAEGVVLSVMNEQVIVRILGEIWEARSSTMLNPGEKVKVENVQGLTLFVEPLEKRKNSGD